MKNTIKKEKTISSISELLSEITIRIQNTPNAQFFISYELIKRLLEKDKDSVIWEEDNLDYFDEVEEAYIINIYNQNKPNVFQIHFIKVSEEYIRVTFFACKGLIYRNYYEAM